MFSTVRVNSQIFILDKASQTFEVGSVIAEPIPRYAQIPQNTQNPMFNTPYGQMMTVQVVDLKVQTPSGVQTLKGLPFDKPVYENEQKTVFVTEDKDTMLNELRGLRTQSENHVKMTKYHEEMIPKFDEWIGVLNPEAAEKKRQEQEIDSLKKAVQEQAEMYRQSQETNQQLMAQMQALLSKLDGGNKNIKNKE